MKILILSSCFPRKKLANHGVFIYRQAKALADLGVECEVLQPVDWSPPAPFHLFRIQCRTARENEADMLSDVGGIRVHHPRVFHPFPSRFFPGDYWTRQGRAVAGYVASNRRLAQFDLLYAHFMCNEGYAGWIAKQYLNMPLVAIARGDDVHLWPARWPDRKLKLAKVLKHADGLLACSHGLARDASNWAVDGLSCPIEVVYNGIDTEIFRPPISESERGITRARHGLPIEGFLFFTVATPIAVKGWLDLFDALAGIDAAAVEWNLVMVGAPRDSMDLDLVKEARERGIDSRVHWLRVVPPDQMPELYRAVDAFVLASHNEGLSNSVLEAMATGLPTITTRVGGHDEIMENGTNGFLVEPRDIDGLKSALTRVLNSFGHDSAMRASARERALRIGGYRSNSKKLIEYFEQLLRAKRQNSERQESPVDRLAGSRDVI